MANTDSQAQQIKDLLVEKMEAYDPTLNTGEGSAFYSQVVAPVFSAMGVDPFDTDIEEFLLTRLRQEFPSIPAEKGDAVVDLLIRPLQLLLESFKRELQIIRAGQSINNSDVMRLADAEDLAANFFVTRRTGSRASGIVRLYFSQPTFVSIMVTTEFRTSQGLSFFPNIPQFFRPETVAVQRSGDQYYIDVTVVAEEEGDEYNIEPNAITSVGGIGGVSRVTNLFEFGGGSVAETGPELLSRTKASLTERSLNTRRGIRARLFSEFTSIRNMEVVGYGDPEMKRDRITGGGGMDNLCSGMCFIVGRYAMLFTMFEDHGVDGDRFLKDGDTLDLNFWKFLYEPSKEKAMQRFSVESVIYNSEGDLENIPTVYLVKLDEAPDMDVPVASGLPGVLPGVFFTAYTTATITISHIPGGITNPDDEGRILVEDGAVHIGGHYDVYVRPASSSSGTASTSIERGKFSLHEGTNLVTSGEISAPLLLSEGALSNKVHAQLRLHIVPISGTLGEGEVVTQYDGTGTLEDDTSAYLLDLDLSEGYADLAALTSDNEWVAGRFIKGRTSGATARIVSIRQTIWEDLGVTHGMTLNIISGADAGVYKILDVRGPELILDLEMTVLGQGYRFRITDESSVDVFNPQFQIFPFAEASADDLSTVIGTPTVRVYQDLSLYGVEIGHVLEILSGDNMGEYTIQGFDDILGPQAPILDRVLRATDSDLEYRIFKPGSGLTAPLVRISPGGVEAVDVSGQSSGFTIPPSESVGAEAYAAFSGARASYLGLNGFVLPDPGPEWMPSANTVVDVDTMDSATLASIEKYYGSPADCYSRGCTEYEDSYIAVINIVDMPDGSGGHDIRVHLDLDLPTEATAFMQTLRDWLVSIVQSFEMGDDFRSLIDLFAPVSLDAIDTTSWNIIAQYEVLIPQEIFDGCNNVFVAIPEYNWGNEFGDDITFQDAMDKYNNGELRGGKPALTKASPGSALTVLSGANAGSYVISKVYRYSLVNGGAINTAGTDGFAGADSDDYINKNKMFEIVLVCIDDGFPVEPFKGLAEYFDTHAGTSTALSLPTPPPFNVQSTVRTGADAGTVLGPWEVVQQAMTWLFQFLTSSGFDVPEEFVVTPDSVLKKLTQTFFVDYVVGDTTCEQITRMKFLEPTSVTAYGNRSCFNYTWYETDTAAASLTGSEITLPVPTSEGLPVTIVLDTLGAKETLTEDITAGIAAETDPTAFISSLQSLLDSESSKILVTGEQVGDHSVSLTLTSVEEGVDVQIRVEADDETQALRHLGFATGTGVSVASIPWDPDTLGYEVRGTSLGEEQAEFEVRYRFQYLVFADSLGNIGSPEPGDLITQDGTGATGSTNEGTIVGVMTSSANTSTVVLIRHGGGTTHYFDGGVYWRGDSSTAYTPDDDFIDSSTARVLKFGSEAPTGVVSSDTNGDAMEFSELTLPAVTTAAEWESGISTFNSNLQTILYRVVIDHILEGLEDKSIGFISTYFGSYTFGSQENVTLSLADDVMALSLATKALSDGLYTEWAYSMGSSTISGTPSTEYETFLEHIVAAFSEEEQAHNLSVSKGSSASGTTDSVDPIYQFSHYAFGGVADSTSGLTWGSTPSSATEIDTAVAFFSEGGPSPYDVETLCQNLNASSTYSQDSGGSSFLQFYVPVSGSSFASASDGHAYINVRSLYPGYSGTVYSSNGLIGGRLILPTSLQVSPMGVTTSSGTSSTGEAHTVYMHPTAPTLFSATAGAAELLYVATGSEAPFQVFPGETSSGKVAPKDLYRDLNLSTHYADAKTFTATFSSEAYASPLLAGVRSGIDILRVYEQKVSLAVAGSGGEVLPEKFDRVVAVQTTYGSSEISLPSLNSGDNEFTFLSASSDLERDEIVPGNILFIEEGDDLGSYIVQSVSDTAITLDRSLTSTTAQMYKAGNEGSIDSGTAFTDTNAPFTSDDVGRHLTIFCSNYEGVDGSYQITSVTDSSTVELDIPDGAFPVSETGVHYAVVKAPIDDLEDSAIDGATELHGVVPIRIYNHIPTQWRVATYHPTVSRASSDLICTYAGASYPADNAHIRDLTYGPVRGYLQPYEIVREKVVHMSSTAMKAQGRDNGLYYFDIRTKSLGGDAVYNIPKETPLTPIFGTYSADGYRMEVEDPLFSYSLKEKATLHFTSRFLPADLNDVEDNKVSVEGLSMLIKHEYSPLVSSIQSLLLSSDNRTLCADPLARHFLPSYVYFDVSASGGNSSMGNAISDYIDGLEPDEKLDVSIFEKYLHRYGVTSYSHPLTVQIITYDLDRKAVLTKSHDGIGSENDEADFNGSHRTTFYIPGEVRLDDLETDIPDGERIYIKARN